MPIKEPDYYDLLLQKICSSVDEFDWHQPRAFQKFQQQLRISRYTLKITLNIGLARNLIEEYPIKSRISGYKLCSTSRSDN